MRDPEFHELSDEAQGAIRSIVEHEQRFAWFYIPWNWLVRREEERRQREHPQWNESHYEGWSTDALVWRILFLQGAGRMADCRRALLADRVLPIAVMIAAVIGLIIGRLSAR